ncbi:hypothetical protein LTR08_008351 [Meristemomyces frigidus]|nr:hypothetical protein LTR08_008351 [Meristemomyces frigidus]
MAHPPPTIDRLLNLVPDSPAAVPTHLEAHPHLAAQQDAHGYSLVHAATSYNHLALLRALVRDYHVDPNITDEDGETALFNAETVEMARELLQLGVRKEARNDEGQTAAEKLADEDEQPAVAAFLREAAELNAAEALHANGDANGVDRPPPMPNGVQVNVGTMQPDEAGDEPDPEFRRRIEELAAREDFEGEEGQRQLRDLITDAVSGLTQDGQAPASSRRRLE